MTTIGDGDPFQQISGDGLSQSMVRKIDDRFKSDETKKAMGNRDYEIRSINVSFLVNVLLGLRLKLFFGYHLQCFFTD